MEISTSQLSKRVFGISWPILLEVTLASLFGMVNMVVLGNYEQGEFASNVNVAAVGLVNGPTVFILTIVQALGVGGTTLIARSFGAKETKRLGIILKHNLLLGMLLSTVCVGASLLFQRNVMTFMGANAETLAASQIYYRFIVVGLWFNCVTALIAASVRGVGETQIPMKINVMANTLNVILAYTLVYGLGFLPELGIVGAGIATFSSNLFSSVMLIYYVTAGKSVIRIRWFEKFKIEWHTLQLILRFGLPSMGEQFILRFSIILYTKIVASLGTSHMAAHQIALNILSLSITPGQALGIAASTLVGQSLGAKEPVLADRYGKQCAKFGLIFGCVMSVVFLLLRGSIGHLYTSNMEVVTLLSIPMFWMALMTPFQLLQLVQVGALRGVGDTVFPMFATGFSVLCIRVALSYLFVKIFGWGLAGAWQAVVCDQMVRSLLITWRYRQGKWQEIQV